MDKNILIALNVSKKIALNRKFQIGAGIFILLFAVWLGVKSMGKNLEDFLLWRITSSAPQILPAKLLNLLPFSKPIRNWEVGEVRINAQAAVAVEINDRDQKKFLYQKDEGKKLPIASITKLMTALVVVDDYNLSEKVKISPEAVAQEGEQGQLTANEALTVENLLYIMLMESSNDAAFALSEVLGKDAFISLMNLKARVLGLENTRFFNPHGLDNPSAPDLINYSTTDDLTKLTAHLLKNRPLIWKILNLKEFHLYRSDGSYHHKLVNTNELLGKIPELIGGKTGWTPQAKGCLLLAMESPRKEGYLIYIILGSDNDRFEEMQKLIDWTHQAYIW